MKLISNEIIKNLFFVAVGVMTYDAILLGEEPLEIDYSIIPRTVTNNAVALRDRALSDNLSVDIVESLTTEVGPRRMGTDGDQRAISWALDKFKELGFDRFWTEEVLLDRGWVRGEAKAEILSPYPHNIVMTALGYSVGTNGDLIGELVEFKTFAELEALPEGNNLKGKIAFVSYSMSDFKPQPGQSLMGGYREGTKARSRGHVTAAKRGAEALIIRSVGTDNSRYAHTGSGYSYEEGVKRIPAAAISAPDAVLIQNILKREMPVMMKMNMTSEITGPKKGANIIGEITGSEHPDQYLVLGAHIDSWDEGTGALDDGAGVGSMMATAAFIGQMEKRPKRSLRVLLFAGEEIGFYGVNDYIKKHKDDLDKHVLGAEVDSGGGRVHTLIPGVGSTALSVINEMHKLIAPLGIVLSEENNAKGASDMSVLGEAGMPALNFSQNSNDYFKYHHTPNDTFDKIIAEDMRYLTAAYSTIFYIAAEIPIDFRH
ncbi:MAG: M28 family peptidase [Pseudomonadota bacterium]|nr:M28 family peptidase [Pseudomonadota bacterium]